VVESRIEFSAFGDRDNLALDPGVGLSGFPKFGFALLAGPI
jgi:hypothetical protein